MKDQKTLVNKIKTNYMLQIQCPHKAISPNACVMCGANSELVSHPFLQCPTAELLWNTLFGILGKYWVCLDQFLLTSCASSGKRKEAKSLWQCAMYAAIWSI